MKEESGFSGVTHYTHVDVQPGGINIQNVEHLYQADILKQLGIELTVKQKTEVATPAERVELFHFVHPEIEGDEAWRVHDAVKRVVRLQGIQMICQYLSQLRNEKKLLLPPNPSAAYAELVRMGMPSGEGFNEITFRKYYNKR